MSSFESKSKKIYKLPDFVRFLTQTPNFRKKFGAGDGTQTRDLCLGKASLYQLSYSRNINCEIQT